MPKGKHVNEKAKHMLDITTINKGLIIFCKYINKMNQIQIFSFSEHKGIFQDLNVNAKPYGFGRISSFLFHKKSKFPQSIAYSFFPYMRCLSEKKRKNILLGYAVKSTAASSVQCIHNSPKRLFLSLSL